MDLSTFARLAEKKAGEHDEEADRLDAQAGRYGATNTYGTQYARQAGESRRKAVLWATRAAEAQEGRLLVDRTDHEFMLGHREVISQASKDHRIRFMDEDDRRAIAEMAARPPEDPAESIESTTATT